jgi:hypothetical protein
MRTFWKWAVVLAVPVTWVAAARPQEPTLPTGNTVRLLLLRQKSVQKELGISADAAKKIMAFTEKQSEAAGKAIGMAEAERKKAFAKLQDQNKKFLADTLNAKQKTRLEQLYLQFTAPYQLTRAKATKELKLNKDQQQKFKDLYKQYRKEMGDILFGKDTKDRAEKFGKLRSKTRTKILSILTKKQQAQVKKAVGAPFTGKTVFEEDSPTKE